MATTLKCLIIDVMNAHDLRLAAWRMGLDAPPSGLAMRGLLLRRTRVTPHLLLPYLWARQVRAVGASVGVRSSGHITLVQTLLEGGASAHAQRVVARRPISRGVSRWLRSATVCDRAGPGRGPAACLVL